MPSVLSRRYLALPLALAGGFSAMLLAGPAHGYCRTTTASTPTFDGHVCTPAQADDTGLPLFWGMPRVTYSIQKDASKEVPFESMRTAVRAAFDTWMDATCEDGEPPRIEVVEADPAECTLHEYNSDRGNANILFFVDVGWNDAPSRLAVTTVTFNLETGEIYDADMALNSDQHDFITGGMGMGMDLESVLTHEAGHFLGLAHSNVGDATMMPSYSPPEVKDLRTLAEDDIAGICAIYPPGPIAEDCDPTPRHGFSVLCESDQPEPVPDDLLPGAVRCCCVDEADECVDGACVEVPGGCSCTSMPAPANPWPAALPFGALVAALAARRRGSRRS